MPTTSELESDLHSTQGTTHTDSSAEIKRDRRLARNRASARLRRQRKRSTIETLEHRIENLNLRIEKLQAYSFGSGLERGSKLSPDIGSRNQPMSQPKEKVRIESTKYYLDNTCRDMKIVLNNQVFAALMNCVNGATESTVERRGLQQELRDILDLSEAQKHNLTQELDTLAPGNNVAHQYTTMCALLQCSMVGIDSNWFDSELHKKVTDTFLESVTEEQNKRYMNWSDRNTDAISLLSCSRPTETDTTNSYMYPAAGTRQGKPVFYFGGKGSGTLGVILGFCWCWLLLLLVLFLCVSFALSFLSHKFNFFLWIFSFSSLLKQYMCYTNPRGVIQIIDYPT